MHLSFTKMQGLGNDFVVIDGLSQPVALSSTAVRQLADRRYGVGCDQVLVVEPPAQASHAFRYRIYNADGGEVEQCGNGARCVARFVREKGLAGGERFVAESAAGPVTLLLEGNGQVSVDMGAPRFEPAEIPFEAPARARRYELAVDGETVSVGVVSMGNPHTVLQVNDTETAPVTRLGPAIESHPRFPRRTNVGFMQVVGADRIRLRVYERGTGETLACGSGACAAVVVGQDQGLLDSRVAVELPGGQLVISWHGSGSPVWMTGAAETVFEGRIEL